MTATLPPQYDPSSLEAAIYQRWKEAGAFAPDPAGGGAPYVIVIPPPNVTDRLHMGHGLNNTLQDVLIRFERMRGRETLWMPGTDHAGIATQNVVERLFATETGQTRHDVGRDAFVERVWSYVRETGGTILAQLEAIGASCDWSRTRFTLDDGYSAAVRRVFVQLHQEGLVYRGQRVIHWCPRCGTSLSDEEAEFVDEEGALYHIRYKVQGAGGSGQGEEFLTIATTRPETIFADVAVVFHPDDERYAALNGREVEIPLINLAIPIKTHPLVERDFGTGMLKVTPAHDPNDFDIANALWKTPERPDIMTAEAHLADVPRVPAALRGVDRFAARKQTVALLEAAGHLVKTEPHRHAVRHCYRCQTVVEPRLSDQWFVRMAPLAKPALDAYHQGALAFVPERWGAVYERWLSEIRDWNISRQLWWGHRIPAWYCADGHITVAETAPTACATCGGAVRQDDDVLDTWFSSWLWPFATLGWPEQTADLQRYYPGHTLVTGPDIIFFWVARMVMGGYHFLGKPPFRTVFLNGIVRDTKHQKMSKSKGNGIDPLVVVRNFGADALRYTMVAGSGLGTDVILDPHDLETSFGPGRNFANKLWNVGRFILSHLDAPTPAPATLDNCQFELADRWILSRCQGATADVTAALEKFRLNDAAAAIYHFLWDEVADWYVEQVKPRLYGEAKGGDVARAILAEVLGTALTLLHPIMPFVTEALWEHLPRAQGSLLVTRRWPVADANLVDVEAEDRFARVQALVVAIRQIRAEYGVAPGTAVRAQVQAATIEATEAFQAEHRTVERLTKVAPLTLGPPAKEVGASAVLPDGSAVFVPLGDAIDLHRERRGLSEEVARLDGLLAAQAAKLANTQFTSRAPADVVARERAKEQAWSDQRATVAEKRAALGT